MTTTTVASVAISGVVSALYAIQTQDDANREGAINARTYRLDYASLLYSALKVKGVTASGISKAIETERETRDLSDDVASFASDTMIGLYATVGEILTLPGEFPADVTVTRVAMDLKEVTLKNARPIIRKKDADIESVVATLRALAQNVIDERKAPKTALTYLKAATGPIGKASEMDWDSEALAAAQELFATLGKALEKNSLKIAA